MKKITGKPQTLVGLPIEWQGPSDHIEILGPKIYTLKTVAASLTTTKLVMTFPDIFFTKQWR